ncbi:hypothetical protein ACWC9T_31325 [Kitasatospora sp. NPDC001159]
MRAVHVPPAWSGPRQLLAQTPGMFRLDRTLGQDTALYVAAEKDILRRHYNRPREPEGAHRPSVEDEEALAEAARARELKAGVVNAS